VSTEQVTSERPLVVLLSELLGPDYKYRPCPVPPCTLQVLDRLASSHPAWLFGTHLAHLQWARRASGASAAQTGWQAATQPVRRLLGTHLAHLQWAHRASGASAAQTSWQAATQPVRRLFGTHLVQLQWGRRASGATAAQQLLPGLPEALEERALLPLVYPLPHIQGSQGSRQQGAVV